MTNSSHVLPPNLPVPTGDGACTHLCGAALPDIALTATDGMTVHLGKTGKGYRPTVVFFYPRTGVPGEPPNLGFSGEDWDEIPGARGCTPQSCGFRDLFSEFASLGVRVFGISTNSTEHQREFKQRNHVPFEFLSDSGLELVHAMRLPTFEFPVESGGPNTLIKRMAWFVNLDNDGVARVQKVWYPVFPPDQNAANVLAWIRQHKSGAGW